MPIIRQNTGIITQINVFTVKNGRQHDLLEYLARAADTAREVEGWVSASIHRSLDGTRVVNYAQSRDLDSARRIFDHLDAKGLIAGNKEYGLSDPGLYEVVFTLEG